MGDGVGRVRQHQAPCRLWRPSTWESSAGPVHLLGCSRLRGARTCSQKRRHTSMGAFGLCQGTSLPWSAQEQRPEEGAQPRSPDRRHASRSSIQVTKSTNLKMPTCAWHFVSDSWGPVMPQSYNNNPLRWRQGFSFSFFLFCLSRSLWSSGAGDQI